MNGFVEEQSFEYGKFLSNPPPGDEVVISGISGRFPKSENVHELRENLMNKAEMVTESSKRFGDVNLPELPEKVGLMNSNDDFDCGFFGILQQEAYIVDPLIRILSEVIIEAILDAGMNPSELEGTNTGVFVGVCNSECARIMDNFHLVHGRRGASGIMRSMLAHRISYYLKLKGSSFSLDSACSSSLFAIEEAYRAVRSGEVDCAIVGGAGNLHSANTTVQFARLGVLSPDSCCRCFDEAGNGYVRSEAVSAIILQKSKDAKRIYSKVVHAKTNCDGFKEHGITFPSSNMQRTLFREFYKECPVRPSDVYFMEAHGTGTKVGDPEEFSAIESVFLDGRTKPLLLGSIKSNLGHTEATSGLCSVAKAIIAYETGIIPPNLNYNKPKKGLTALEDGRIIVVNKRMPLQDGRNLIGINSFGFGGSNCHVLLERSKKYKSMILPHTIGRIVCVSGRTEEAVHELLDSVPINKFDPEYVRLLHDIFKKNIKGHNYRGYIVESSNGKLNKEVCFIQQSDVYMAFGEVPDLQFLYNTLTQIPLLKQHIENIQNALSKKGTNLKDNKHEHMNMILTGFIVQTSVAKLLQDLTGQPLKIISSPTGKLASAYLDGNLNLEDVLDVIYQSSKPYQNGHNHSENLTEKNRIILDMEQTMVEDKVKGTIKNSIIAFHKQLKMNSLKHKVVLKVGRIENLADGIRLKVIPLHKKCTNVQDLLTILGKLYLQGQNYQLHKLYPHVEFPVKRGTPMISPHIKWNHSRKHGLPDSISIRLSNKNTLPRTIQTTDDREWGFATGHIINGRNLFPATGYIFLVWQTFSEMNETYYGVHNVVFENVHFRRSTIVPKPTEILELTVSIATSSGDFEIAHGDVPVVTGRVYSANNNTNITSHQFNFDVKSNADDKLIMDSKDIYKELRLRGYEYRGIFRSITESNQSFTSGKLTWQDNWVAFMDNMLQIKILDEDTRQLYVPTSISKLSINPTAHMNYVENDKNVPLYVNHLTGTVSAGAIQISGLMAMPITKRKPLGYPVLEKYIFVPNQERLNLPEAIRVQMQVILENTLSVKMKIIEMVDDCTVEKENLLAPIIKNVLGDQPLIQPDITILSNAPIEDSNFEVEIGKLGEQLECILIVGSQLLCRPKILQQAFLSLTNDGFILSREDADSLETSTVPEYISVISVYQTDKEKIVLFQKRKPVPNLSYVKVSVDNEFKWIDTLKDTLKKNDNVVVYVQNEPLSGIIGLVNCIRREPKCQNVKCVFIVDDNVPQFDPEDRFYKSQLSKNLAINVFKNGQWGTYRHLLLDSPAEAEYDHCYAFHTVKGDLSSVKWVKGSLTNSMAIPPEHQMVHIYYSSLNFRDVMLATAKIALQSSDRRLEECVQGLEFSGRTADGRRVMGMAPQGALSNMILADSYFTFEVPDEWSLEEAATVPLVYATVLAAFVMGAGIKRGDSVLIHCGTGGIGQAALNICQGIGCTIFTTVGTKEKKEFIRKQFPKIPESHIGHSRDISFEQMIIKETNGRGVDIVLNSLADEKLLASVRCLAQGGRFLEIGKYDLMNNSSLNLLFLQKEASFHGIMLDKAFYASADNKQKIKNLVLDALKNKWVKPLNTTIFNSNQLEEAYRFMATGKHMGKVLVEIRKEEGQKICKPSTFMMKGLPKYICDPDKSYIICGGLGGFGLELADWLVLRGAMKLVLTSRTGIQTGYQQYRINIWKKYGCEVLISTQDITNREGCEKLIEEAKSAGPVQAIFNLAVVLEDSILENQTVEKYQISFGPKAYATQHLDELSRVLCPELRDFVVFSSVSCGRGNAGQTNYGMANSVMERICEKRRSEGLPALAIQWGAIGDVGLVAKMQEEHTGLEIGGTLQQGISNCLEVLDNFLNCQDEAVVGSMVVAMKRSSETANSAVEAVAAIMGIDDLKSVSMHSTLAELGMDSMTAVEIKQTLERDFDLIVPDEKVRTITLAQIKVLEDEKESEEADESPEAKSASVLKPDIMLALIVPEVATAHIPVFPYFKNEGLPKIFAFPGVEGTPNLLAPLATSLNANVDCLQYCNGEQVDTIPEMAQKLTKIIETSLEKNKPFNLVAHSYGAMVALEVARILEEMGYLGSITCIDGAPLFFKGFIHSFFKGKTSGPEFETAVLIYTMSFVFTYSFIRENLEKINSCETLSEKIHTMASLYPEKNYEPQFLVDCMNSSLMRINSILNYEPNLKLSSRVILYKPSATSLDYEDQDYGLSSLCSEPVQVKIFEGDHQSILRNQDLANEINNNYLR